MNQDECTTVSERAETYADSMCDGDPGKRFCRGSIAAAYIVGADDMLRRIRLIITGSGYVGGLSADQARKLLRLIDLTERRTMPLQSEL